MDALSGSVGSYLGQQGVSAMQVGQLRWVSSSSSFVPEDPLIHFQSPSGKRVNPCNREGCRQQSFAVGLTLCTGRAGMYRLLSFSGSAEANCHCTHPGAWQGHAVVLPFFRRQNCSLPTPPFQGLPVLPSLQSWCCTTQFCCKFIFCQPWTDYQAVLGWAVLRRRRNPCLYFYIPYLKGWDPD